MMELGLAGKVALVTGTGSQIGFGKAIALTLAKEGSDIVSVDMDLEGAQKTAAEVEALGRKAIALKVDVTNNAEVNNAVKKALAEFKKIDILVNNAGAITPMKPFIEKTPTEWEKDININLVGVLNCTMAVLGQMMAHKSGKIVNISSLGGKMGVPTVSVYAAAKAGVIGFTRALATEVGALGINVNCVAPGMSLTAFAGGAPPSEILEGAKLAVPLKRFTTPQDIANMVVFLASDAASDITGQTFSVDGGQTMA
ncbi:MAG: SDR family NAD(P)-dependent oxidoreductase [Dehalococcoidia bacterium]|jgi:NAD(P)-dependent dehydrogenase (short-subunit alcohol dehydrogenase family)